MISLSTILAPPVQATQNITTTSFRGHIESNFCVYWDTAYPHIYNTVVVWFIYNAYKFNGVKKCW